MKKKLDIAVVGELNVDLILTGLASLPVLGTCQLSGDMHFTLGSASAIFASNIARLRLNVGFIGKIGNDEFGNFILKSLKKRDVDTSRIIRDKHNKTGICVSLSFPENYAMASYAGVRETMTIDDIDFKYLLKARHLHMSSYYLQPGMQAGCATLFKKAKKSGLTTSLDPDSDPSGKWDDSIYNVLKYVDIFLPNEREALKISGCKTIDAALDHLSKTVKTVVIKAGAGGVWVNKGAQKFHTKAFRYNVLDTTGAGDSFNSGFIYRFYRGADVQECAVWGNACAAISTGGMGGTMAFPSLSEVRKFLGERKSEIITEQTAQWD